tara:strand:+ start:1435 stop:2151 length:717 start_codon:yes stop_codon:yes gene_type:complete
MNYKVYIPSKGRAGKVTSHKLFLESFIVCPNSEVDDYKKHHENVIGVPNKIKGITATRNWILEYNKDDYQIQVDDDARSFHKYEKTKLVRFTDPERIDTILNTMFLITEEIGFKVWGLAMAADYKFYRPYSPFTTQGVVGANIIGIINNPLRFDERLRVKEDYDYSMQHIYKYGGVVRTHKFGIDVIHLTNEGGCVGYRTKEVELQAYDTLLNKYGPSVVKFQDNKNFVRMKSPRKGI